MENTTTEASDEWTQADVEGLMENHWIYSSQGFFLVLSCSYSSYSIIRKTEDGKDRRTSSAIGSVIDERMTQTKEDRLIRTPNKFYEIIFITGRSDLV